MPLTLDHEDAVRIPLENVDPKPTGKLSMASINFWLDAALFVNLIFILWVTAVLNIVFPLPTETTGWTLWGLTFNEWHGVQFLSLCGFALLAIEHLVLHWNWVCSILATKILRAKSKPDEGVQAVYGVGTFIVILVLSLASLIAAMAMVKHPAG